MRRPRDKMPFVPHLLPMALRGVRSSIAGDILKDQVKEQPASWDVCLWAHTKVMVTGGTGGKDAEMQREGRILSYR